MECLESFSVIFKSTMKRFKQIFTFLSQHRKTEHATKSLRSFLNISVCLHVLSATIKLIWTKPCFTRVCALQFLHVPTCSHQGVFTTIHLYACWWHISRHHTHTLPLPKCVCVCVSLLGNRGGTREEEGGRVWPGGINPASPEAADPVSNSPLLAMLMPSSTS